MFTMHGTTMIFLVVMPMAAAFANYLMPLQIGARDVAFPRSTPSASGASCSAASSSTRRGSSAARADGGWFVYAPNTDVLFSPSHGIDFWTLGLQITGIASLTGAINLIVTVLNMRAPGHDADAHAGVHVDDAWSRSSCWCSPSRSSPWRCSC